MDNVDVALDSVARVDDDSGAAPARETEGWDKVGGTLLASRPASEIGVTSRFVRALADMGPTGDVQTDIAELRNDVNWLLTLLFSFIAALALIILFRR